MARARYTTDESSVYDGLPSRANIRHHATAVRCLITRSYCVLRTFQQPHLSGEDWNQIYVWRGVNESRDEYELCRTTTSRYSDCRCFPIFPHGDARAYRRCDMTCVFVRFPAFFTHPCFRGHKFRSFRFTLFSFSTTAILVS